MFPNYPAIVGAVASATTLQRLPKLMTEVGACDLLEFRLDSICAESDTPAFELPHSSSHTLITARDPDEGGVGNLDESQRRSLYETYLSQAAILDIEIRNLNNLAEVRQAAQADGRLVLGSFHDFHSTPPESALHAIIERGLDAGADGIKLAVTTNTPKHIRILLRLLEKHCGKIPIAVMGMGALGKSSRILFAQCGSVLNYAYLSESNAPGQWSSVLMRALFDKLGISPPNPT